MVTNRSTWTLSIAFFLLYVVAMSFIGSVVPSYLSFGLSYETAVLIMMLGGFFAIFGSVIFGFIDQKIGTKTAASAYALVMALAVVFASLAPKGIAFAWIAAIILFWGNGALMNLLPSFVATIYGRWDYSAAYRVIGTIFSIGAGVGISCGGWFAGRYVTMYIMDICLAIVAFVLIRLTSDKLIGKPDDYFANAGVKAAE